MYDYDDSWYYQDNGTFTGEYDPYNNELMNEVYRRCDWEGLL